MLNEKTSVKPSVAARLARTIFILISAATATAMFAVDFFIDDADDTILNLELKEDAEFFKEQLEAGTFRPIKTPRLDVFFLPAGESESLLPLYFQDLTLPYADEFEENGVTKQVYAKELEDPAGRLFLAQDTTTLESRQGLIQWTLIGITCVMFLAAFFFSRASANYLVRPLKRLTHEIQSIEPSKSMRRCHSEYRDREFADIAHIFNRFLSELESHIERERSFVKLASHELRTPLAVISGALEVIGQRGGLSAANQITINRIRTTTNAMKDDIEVLLALARSEDREEPIQRFSVQQLAKDLIADLEHGTPEFQGRVTLSCEEVGAIVASPSLVRMLLRNLIQNALRHTRSNVELTVKNGEIVVRDFGAGLSAENMKTLSGADQHLFDTKQVGNFRNSTFGLLVVRLVADRLGWSLELVQSNHQGTEFRIHTQGSLPHD